MRSFHVTVAVPFLVCACAGARPEQPARESVVVAPAAATDAGGDGNVYGDTLGDSFGFGGLGLAGNLTAGDDAGPHQGNLGIGGAGHGRRGAGNQQPSGGLIPARSPTSRAPSLHQGATHVTGSLSPEVIQRVTRQSFGRFRLCYEEGLRRLPTLEGRVVIRFTIDSTGAVAKVDDAGSTIPDAAVVACVARGFGKLSFPAPEAPDGGPGEVTVVYPILFKPGSP